MKRSLASALLTSAVIISSIVTVYILGPIPDAYAQPREEIRLTTIIPDQQVLRVKKGIISTLKYRQADFPDGNIPANSLIVAEGRVGIGTTDPQATLDIGGTPGPTNGIIFPNRTIQTTAGAAFGNYGPVTTISTVVPGAETNEFPATKATTDLLLVATCVANSDSWVVVGFKGYTGTTSNPNIYRGGMAITNDWGLSTRASAGSFMMFVKKDEYYVVKGWAHMDAGTTRTYCTIPVGS